MQVLERISLAVNDGETVTLLGTNGNGKSTLMKCIMGIVPPSAGRIAATIDGVEHDLVGKAPEQIVDLGISLVPEGRRLFPRLSVEENLLLGAYRRSARALIAKNLEFCFETFPVLAERRAQLAGSMSGGEQQMLTLARALMTAPKILLIDEPSVGLAPILVIHTIDKIRELKESYTELQPGDPHRRSRLRHRARPDRVRGALARGAGPQRADPQALHGIVMERTTVWTACLI